MNLRDPFVLAVLFEDAAACTGVAFAALGIYLSKLNNDVSYDTLAGISVGLLLAGVAVKLVQINHKFLIGQAVDEEIVADIRSILRGRAGINAVYDIQSQWIGPSAFAFKAECDFNGFFFSRKLQDLYVPLFLDAVQKQVSEDEKHQELAIIMSWMAEDITRLIEQEVKEVETIIRKRHPMAAFIELEPDSKKSFLRAYDGRAWREMELTQKPELASFRLLNLDREMSLPLTQKLLEEEELKRAAVRTFTDIMHKHVENAQKHVSSDHVPGQRPQIDRVRR
jgi:zinc transporter 9